MSHDTYNISLDNSTLALDTDSTSSSSDSGGITSGNGGLLKQVMDGAFADGKFDKNDLAAMQSILGMPSNDSGSSSSSSSSQGKGGMSDGQFLSAVDNIANQSDPGIGPGEKMMQEQAKRLVEGGGTAADKKAFLKEANQLLNNEDGDGKDIDEVNDHEGTQLKGFTDALLADNKSSSSGSTTQNGLISDFLDQAYQDGKLSSTELKGLQALEGGATASNSGNTTDSSTSGYKTTASSNYSYNDLVKSMIYSNMENNLINQDSGSLALSYITDDNNA